MVHLKQWNICFMGIETSLWANSQVNKQAIFEICLRRCRQSQTFAFESCTHSRTTLGSTGSIPLKSYQLSRSSLHMILMRFMSHVDLIFSRLVMFVWYFGQRAVKSEVGKYGALLTKGSLDVLSPTDVSAFNQKWTTHSFKCWQLFFLIFFVRPKLFVFVLSGQILTNKCCWLSYDSTVFENCRNVSWIFAPKTLMISNIAISYLAFSSTRHFWVLFK